MTRNRVPSVIFVTLFVFIAMSFELFHGERGGASELTASRRIPVLVELFTSEGCSSCPPADALLGLLDRSQPVPGAEVIVLSEHVDYWDDIGWKDPYSSRQFSTRQSDYARRFGLEGPYTPQMIVDGQAQLVGSDQKEALRAIGNAVKLVKLPVGLSARHQQGDKSILVHVDVKSIASSSGRNSDQVLVALADESDQSNVGRGENAGRTLRHVAVVRTLTPVGTIDNSGAFTKEMKLNAGSADLKDLRVVAIVQEANTGRVLGVGSTRVTD